MEHKFLKLFVNGVWTRPNRTIKVNGVEHDMDEYAKEHGITLPDSKKSKKQVNSYADLDKQDDSRDTKVDGSGDSQSTE